MKTLLVFAMVVFLCGCVATTKGPVSGVCGVVPMGQTDSGVLVVRVQCEADG